MTLEAADERFEAPQSSRFDAVANAWTIHVAADQAALLQDLEVLRNSRLRERQFFDNFPANAAIFPDEESQDLHPRRVADGLGELCQFFIGLGALDGPEVRSVQRRGAAFGCVGRFHRQTTMPGLIV
jgi:hypothetical protein